MSIVIGADFVPTVENSHYFLNGNVEKVIGPKLRKILDEADYRIFNLEMPLCDEEDKIIKCGPNLSAPTESINLYKNLRVDLFTLANNHIMDQNVQGLESTCTLLKKSGIEYVGVGKTQNEASSTFYFKYNSRVIGIYACAENEFSIVNTKRPGANPFDPLESLDHIVASKNKCDYLVVLYHGGKEHYQYPSPELQKRCRKMVDKGADLVLCQHSHCIGCSEKYSDSIILYGQGNFLFGNNDIETWKNGLLTIIDDEFKVSFMPIETSSNGEMVECASEVEAAQILCSLRERSQNIENEEFIQEKFSEFCESKRDFYLKAFSGKESKIFKVLNRLLGGYLRKAKIRNRYDKHALVVIQNFVECEAHREVVIGGLQHVTRSFE